MVCHAFVQPVEAPEDAILVIVVPGLAAACFVTLIAPVTAPVGTVAVILVLLLTVNEVALTPPNFTELVPLKLDPDSCTDDPTTPIVGVKEVKFTCAKTVVTAVKIAVMKTKRFKIVVLVFIRSGINCS
jgi:uncharacterized membrane protein